MADMKTSKQLSKYTPGPWSNIVPMAGFTAVGSTTLIARVFSTVFRDKDNETANAYLIAAAPELLEACKEQLIRLTDLFNRHERPTYTQGSNPDDDLDLLLATSKVAIAKAEGNQ